jgi:Ca2+-binding RTX toxin-like protein
MRRSFGVASALIAVAALGALLCAPAGDAHARPTCFGKPATIVGSNGSNVIRLTAGKDIVAAMGGNDVVEATSIPNNHGKDVICGGAGNDKITGNDERNILIGGPGNDRLKGGPGNDLIVGDNANPDGSESGATGRDTLNGTGDDDFLVGDNYALGNATGASPDKDILGKDNADVLVGDSASLRGDAHGGATDRLAGADGNDLVVGDSYAPQGDASGTGNDKSSPVNHKGGLNGGPGSDTLVGDNYTKTGTTSGGGRDSLQSGDGGDGNLKCQPGTCDDVFYGDNYSAGCGGGKAAGAILCQIRDTSGGGPDLLTTDQGNDLLVGGVPNDPALRGDGDRCKGGSGRDVAALCEYTYKDVESRLHLP